MRALAGALGGHATRFRGGDAKVPAFQPLEPAVARINTRLKEEFDPAGILNPGKMVPQ
jgi:glycolate oxidase FAD binding subunit